MAKTKLGEALQRVRVRNGISVEEVARRSALSVAEYERLEEAPELYSLGRLRPIFIALDMAHTDLIDFYQLLCFENNQPGRLPLIF